MAGVTPDPVVRQCDRDIRQVFSPREELDGGGGGCKICSHKCLVLKCFKVLVAL